MKENQNISFFQIHIHLPEIFTLNFVSLIPKQRHIVNKLLEDHIILNYSLDLNRKNLWITMKAISETEVMDSLSTFPIIKDVTLDIFELAFFDSAPIGLPKLIMN